MTKKTLLYDTDNLKQVLKGPLFQNLLKQYGFSSQKALLDTLQTTKSQGAELVVGPAGSGKTSYAIKHLGAHPIITDDDVRHLFDMDSYDMVFTKCDPTGIVAEQAWHITGLYLPSSRIHEQRLLRDSQIEEWISETAFGRSPSSTRTLPADSDVMVSLLKTDFPEKSDLIRYTSPNPTNFTEYELVNVFRDLDDEWRYKSEWIVLWIGKIVIPHLGHMAYFDKIVSVGKSHWLRSAMFVTHSSGDDYDFAMTQWEKRKCLEVLNIKDLGIFHGDIRPLLKFWEKDFVKIVPELSIAVLAKDRLPDWFIGTYQDLKENHDEFMGSPESLVAKSITARHGINYFEAGETIDTWDGQPMSATRVRKALVEWNKQELEQLLSPELYFALVNDENIRKAKLRYQLCTTLNEKKQLLLEQKNLFEEQLEEYKKKDLKTGELFYTLHGEETNLTMQYINRKDISPARRKYLLQQVEGYTKKKLAYTQNYRIKLQKLEKQYKEKMYAEKNRFLFPEREKNAE